MPFSPSLAIDAAFAMFGQAATFVAAGGGTQSCTIVVNAADDMAMPMQTAFVTARRRVEVRVSELSSVRKGDSFTLGAQSLVVTAAPSRDDPDQRVWSCLCDPR